MGLARAALTEATQGTRPRTKTPRRQSGWQRARLSIYAPVYDLFIGLHRQRQRSLALLDLKAGERVLIVGAGTGADLPHMPPAVHLLVTDLTPAMLVRARRHARAGVEFAIMDGQHLELPDESFDAVVLHLVLAVVPDAPACLREAARVLSRGGRIAVFDKFLGDGRRASWLRRPADLGIRAVGSSINRRMGDILAASGAGLVVAHDEPALLGAFFRIIVLRKPGLSPDDPVGAGRKV
jgi:phosphatidylethanolamine/phosphatidyl-N-methylethanolamine N-methyltransferase